MPTDSAACAVLRRERDEARAEIHRLRRELDELATIWGRFTNQDSPFDRGLSSGNRLAAKRLREVLAGAPAKPGAPRTFTAAEPAGHEPARSPDWKETS
jgi:hypothetical protein